MGHLLEENEKIVKGFGAEPIVKLKAIPDIYTFRNNLIYSHRDFDRFFKALKKGEKCAIVSGFNASGTIHLGHKPVFDTNLYFQKEYGVPIFIPISDDESYVTGKVRTQEEALKNSLELVKELIAYGFDPNKTYFIIDQLYTKIYNLAFKLSKRVTLSEIKATYGYKNDENIGTHFYPVVQAAHILFPQETFGIKNILVTIGPDEDAHIRICRDIASRMGYEKPSILHATFLPGLDGEKMSKSKNNAIFLKDNMEMVRVKIKRALSGGQKTIEQHREVGGNPDLDMALQYLTKLFLNKDESERLISGYKKGEILSSEIKQKCLFMVSSFLNKFQEALLKVDLKNIRSSILNDEHRDTFN